MFKPHRSSGPPKEPSRHKLPLTERAPKQEDISALFTGALRIRGTIFELPIRPTPMSPIYIITCVFDHGCNETVWSMYEGSESSGPQLFSLPQSDLDMVFDMVCMSCQPKGGSASIPAELQPSYGPDIVPAKDVPVIPTTPTPYAPNYGTSSYQQQQAPQPQAQPPQQQYPPPQPQYQQPPQQAPYQQPYQGQQQQQYPPQQQAPYQQQPFQPAPQGYQQAPQQGFQQPYPYQSQPSQGFGAQTPDIPLPDFRMMDLINKSGQANILIGQLFVGGGIISEKGLDAALRLQELVRNGVLTAEQSVLAMRRAAELGGNLDEDIIEWAKNPEAARHRTGQQARPAQPQPQAQAQRAAQPQPSPQSKDNVTAQRVVDLLKQSGLVNDDDLEMAKRVKTKHGGDIAQILVSAGKVGGKTVDAANEVQNLVAVGRLRIDKAIQALHYCERMRVGLKEALNELSIEL